MKNEEKLCFRISGEAITSLTRTLWADEDAPEKAFRILNAAFPEMSRSEQLAILSGEKKLVGDEHGMDLADDGATASEHGNPLDPEAIFGRLHKKLKTEEKLHKDLQALLLFDEVIVATPQGGFYVPRHRKEAIIKGEVSIEEIPHRAFVIEERRSIRRSEEDEQLPIPKSYDEVFGVSGWLTPEGKFYPCGWMEHIKTAIALGYEERRVEQLGWIKIESTNGAIAPVGEPTRAQVTALWDWCQREEREWPYWLKEDKDD